MLQVCPALLGHQIPFPQAYQTINPFWNLEVYLHTKDNNLLKNTIDYRGISVHIHQIFRYNKLDYLDIQKGFRVVLIYN
jgi:hypothetical protein